MAAACAGGATDATITVDAAKVEGSVTPWLYGACIEDVNHEIYGGLYDQRIFGESFEEPVPNPLFDDCSAYEGGVAGCRRRAALCRSCGRQAGL